MGKRKDLIFDKGQIVMARPLTDNISKMVGLLRCSGYAVVSTKQKWSFSEVVWWSCCWSGSIALWLIHLWLWHMAIQVIRVLESPRRYSRYWPSGGTSGTLVVIPRKASSGLGCYLENLPSWPGALALLEIALLRCNWRWMISICEMKSKRYCALWSQEARCWCYLL